MRLVIALFETKDKNDHLLDSISAASSLVVARLRAIYFVVAQREIEEQGNANNDDTIIEFTRVIYPYTLQRTLLYFT